MSLNAFAGLGAAAAPELFNALGAAPVSARSAHRAVMPRQSNNTIELFLDAENPELEFAASVVGVCEDKTTLAIRCTSGQGVTATCGPNAPVITLTHNPTTLTFSSSTSAKTAGHDVVATVEEGCSLDGTTAAVCSATIGGSVDKTSTAVSTTITTTGTAYYRNTVAITAGAEKTASPSCSPNGGGNGGSGSGSGSGGSGTPSGNGAAGLSARAVAVWGLAGAVGVAALLL